MCIYAYMLAYMHICPDEETGILRFVYNPALGGFRTGGFRTGKLPIDAKLETVITRGKVASG